jgi:hypothetical protein
MDKQLTPANHDDLVQSIAYAFRLNRSGKGVSDWDLVMAHAAAEYFAQALQRAGYVVLRQKADHGPTHLTGVPAGGHDHELRVEGCN